MLRKIVPFASIFSLILALLYNKDIAEFMRTYFDETIVRPIMALITVSLFIYIAKYLWDQYLLLSTEKEKKMDGNLVAIGNDICDIKTDIRQVCEDVEHVKQEVKKTTDAINEINEYKDDKKRWYKEFDMDWAGMKDSFTDPKECPSEIYCTARMFKEGLKTLAVHYHAIDIRDASKDDTLEIFKEKYYTFRDNTILKLKIMLPQDYIDNLCEKQLNNENCFWDEIARILEDRVNKRSEGMQLAIRQLLRRTLNSLHKTWVVYNEKNMAGIEPAVVSTSPEPKPIQ